MSTSIILSLPELTGTVVEQFAAASGPQRIPAAAGGYEVFFLAPGNACTYISRMPDQLEEYVIQCPFGENSASIKLNRDSENFRGSPSPFVGRTQI